MARSRALEQVSTTRPAEWPQGHLVSGPQVLFRQFWTHRRESVSGDVEPSHLSLVCALQCAHLPFATCSFRTVVSPPHSAGVRVSI